MSKAKKYTVETLLPLNVSYDSDHGLTQEDVDMVNSLVEVIESTRSKHTPKIGDRVVYTQKGGEYHPHGLIEKKMMTDSTSASTRLSRLFGKAIPISRLMSAVARSITQIPTSSSLLAGLKRTLRNGDTVEQQQMEQSDSKPKSLYGLILSLIPYTEILQPRIGRRLLCVSV